MKQLFAIVRSRGPAWKEPLPMEEQADWKGHAAFMNWLEETGFIVVGGPLEGTQDVLLIVRAAGSTETFERLATDQAVTDLVRGEQFRHTVEEIRSVHGHRLPERSRLHRSRSGVALLVGSV